MRIITCASYYGTGSSAITDYISEFKNCYSMSDYEFRFVQDPEGISDLEYNLVENHHRHNSGHALKRYKKNVDFLAGNRIVRKYEPFFNNEWKNISYEYIDKLTDFSHKGYWHQDVIDQSDNYYFRKRAVNKLLRKTIWRNLTDRKYNEMPNEVTLYSKPSEEEFLTLTRDYTDKLFKQANKLNKNDIMVDQLVPPANLRRYIRYFNNIKVFVVDRDPRDIFLLEKYVWRGNVIPVDRVEIYCEWFKYTRDHRKQEDNDSDSVKHIQFEDLVYKYDETTEGIKKWLGYSEDENIQKKLFFNPEESINNTRLWDFLDTSKEEILYIENELEEYLYDYNGL